MYAYDCFCVFCFCTNLLLDKQELMRSVLACNTNIFQFPFIIVDEVCVFFDSCLYYVGLHILIHMDYFYDLFEESKF